MRIEVGEYKTRVGDDVTIIAVIDGFAIGYFTESGPETISTWLSSDGWYYATEPDDFDLVRKKPKRIKLDGWLRIYKRTDGSFYTSIFEPVKPSCKEAVAITKIVIDCEEGENLD